MKYTIYAIIALSLAGCEAYNSGYYAPSYPVKECQTQPSAVFGSNGQSSIIMPSGNGGGMIFNSDGSSAIVF